MNSSTVLITGGLGFLGKSLAARLMAAANHKVVIFDNFSNTHPDHYTKGARIIKGDVTRKSDWDKIPSADFIFHFAAPSSITAFKQNKDQSIKTTLLGLQNCIEWGGKNNVKKIIYPSSGSVYGNIDGPCTEDAEVQPLNIYGKTKLKCEHLAKKYQGKIPLLGLRIFAGYGQQEDQKGECASIISLFLNSLRNELHPQIYGDGNQKRDFIYIDDIVHVLLKVMDNKERGILNVGSGKSVTFNEVYRLIQKNLDIYITPKYVSPPHNYLLSTCADTKKLKKYLPKPISLMTGITRMIKC